MRPARALAPLVLCALAHAVPAGDETQRTSSGIEARVWSPWPRTAQKGWAPIFVELRNDSVEEQLVRLDARGMDWSAEREVHTSVRLAPGTSAELEMLVPLGSTSVNQYTLLANDGDETLYFSDTVGFSSANANFSQVLLLGEFVPAAGEVERWAAALSTTNVEEVAGSRFVFGPGGSVVSMTSTTPAVGTTAPPNDVDVAHSRFAGMPRHHAAYSSLDLVVIDTARGMPPEAELAPLVAWVRTGGDLLIIGERAGDEAWSAPALAAWMEPRFENRSSRSAAGVEFRCGLGRLFIGEAAGQLDDAPCVSWVREMLDANAGLTPEPTGGYWLVPPVSPTGGANPPTRWRGAPLTLSIPGLARLPFRSFAALLILFGIVIGPVNFLAVRRRKKPVLLLLTIPAIALVTTLALLAYGIFYQGIDVKTASYSVAVLDQRDHRSACVEARQFFAGLAPARGLALGPGTIVHDLPREDYSGTRKRFEVELAGGTLLGGDYLPSRRATNQVLAVERAERARLDVHKSGDRLRVDNNLGVGIAELIVRDPEGKLYSFRNALAPGTSAELSASEHDVDPDAMVEAVLYGTLPPSPAPQLSPAPTAEVVPAGCYLALLERSPFRDDCGIETNELAGKHVVLGVLPLAPEDWR